MVGSAHAPQSWSILAGLEIILLENPLRFVNNTMAALAGTF
jgi:hypothetical protein